jgi:ferredoxin
MDLKEWRSDELTIKFDDDKCVGHGDYADACPSDVYELEKVKPCRQTSTSAFNAAQV